MLRKSSRLRKSVITVELLFLVYILFASVLSLMNPECAAKTFHLTLEGVYLGILAGCLQLLALAHRSDRVCQFTEGCRLGWILVIHHVKFGIVGGYIFGVTSAVALCLFGW